MLKPALVGGSTTSSAPYGPLGLMAAQMGDGRWEQRCDQPDAFLRSSGTCKLGLISWKCRWTLNNTPDTVKHARLVSIIPSPLYEHETPTAYTTCDNTCGSGNGTFYVDDVAVSGFTYQPGMSIPHQLPDTLTPTPHKASVGYVNSATGETFPSDPFPFQVQANTLPVPKMDVHVTPDPVPQGETGEISIKLTGCGTQCGSGEGAVYINGQFSGSFSIDENGEGAAYTLNTLSAATYSLHVKWFGNSTVSNTDVTQDLVVTSKQLPPGTPTATIDPINIPEHQYAWVHIHDVCNSACGSGQYYIDGKFAGGFFLNDSGDDTVPIYPGVTQGPHTLTVTYFGNADYAPAPSGNIPFTVIENNLPPTTLTAAPRGDTIPANQYSPMTINLVPGAQSLSCEGQGQVFVDGQYSDTFFVFADNHVEGNGRPYALLRPSSPGVSHHVAVNYFGNTSCKYTSYSFDFIPQ